MDLNSLIEVLGISAVVTAGLVWLIKTLGKHFLDINLKRYESELNQRTDNYKLELEKNLESHKSDLNILHSKVSKLYDKRIGVLAELYKKIANLDFTMREMVSLVKFDNNSENEEKKRINAAGNSYNEFLSYYREHKIFFSNKLCLSIEGLMKKYFNSFLDYTFPKNYGIDDKKFTYEQIKTAAETVQKHIPPILNEIEDEFRKLMNVEV